MSWRRGKDVAGMRRAACHYRMVVVRIGTESIVAKQYTGGQAILNDIAFLQMHKEWKNILFVTTITTSIWPIAWENTQ